MYKKISLLITDKFIFKGIIDKDKRNVYSYGFEILISTALYTLIFILAAIITNSMMESIFFWVGFFIIRTIAGGFHAKSYKACHILSLATHLFFILIVKVVPSVFHLQTTLILNLFSIVIILIFAPVDHPNKPFIKKEKIRFRRLSCFYAIILFILSIAGVFFLDSYLHYQSAFAIGTFFAAFALMSAKIKNIKEQKS